MNTWASSKFVITSSWIGSLWCWTKHLPD